MVKHNKDTRMLRTCCFCGFFCNQPSDWGSGQTHKYKKLWKWFTSNRRGSLDCCDNCTCNCPRPGMVWPMVFLKTVASSWSLFVACAWQALRWVEVHERIRVCVCVIRRAAQNEIEKREKERLKEQTECLASTYVVAVASYYQSKVKRKRDQTKTNGIELIKCK